MENVVIVKDANNKEYKIEVLFGFNSEELGKDYIVYTINDDGVKDITSVLISGITVENGERKLVPIQENEKEMVLSIYNDIKNA